MRSLLVGLMIGTAALALALHLLLPFTVTEERGVGDTANSWSKTQDRYASGVFTNWPGAPVVALIGLAVALVGSVWALLPSSVAAGSRVAAAGALLAGVSSLLWVGSGLAMLLTFWGTQEPAFHNWIVSPVVVALLSAILLVLAHRLEGQKDPAPLIGGGILALALLVPWSVQTFKAGPTRSTQFISLDMAQAAALRDGEYVGLMVVGWIMVASLVATMVLGFLGRGAAARLPLIATAGATALLGLLVFWHPMRPTSFPVTTLPGFVPVVVVLALAAWAVWELRSRTAGRATEKALDVA